jgi:hypothetical protein
MAREIPEFVRAVAGLAATVVDEARKLPEQLPGLPVRLVGLAMQTALKLQQSYSGLVARGDEVFTGIRGENEPGLATFDDEVEAQAGGYRASAFDRADVSFADNEVAGLPDEEADAAVAAVEELADEIAVAEEALQAAAEAPSTDEVLDELAIDEHLAAAAPAPAAPEKRASKQAAKAAPSKKQAAPTAAPAEESTGAPAAAPDVVTAGEAAVDEAVSGPAGAAEPAAPPAPEAPAATTPATDEDGMTVSTAPPLTAPVDGYDDWSIAQLRGRLRGYTEQTVRQLLDYEQATLAREPYLRMLRNRLERLQSESA